jgi:hypothetical protein
MAMSDSWSDVCVECGIDVSTYPLTGDPCAWWQDQLPILSVRLVEWSCHAAEVINTGSQTFNYALGMKALIALIEFARNCSETQPFSSVIEPAPCSPYGDCC